MRTPTLTLLSAVGCAVLLGSVGHVVPVGAQTAATPDFTGLWDGAPGGPGTRDLGKYMKSQKLEIPFTALGAERYKNVDLAKNPNAYCLPPGPSRALTGPSPFYIVQHKNVVSFNFENHGVYRVVYLDGTKHPEDIADYPQFMGHSTGKWEGKTLVVDTVGINDRTWLDSYGLEHSDKLHLTERFESIDAEHHQVHGHLRRPGLLHQAVVGDAEHGAADPAGRSPDGVRLQRQREGSRQSRSDAAGRIDRRLRAQGSWLRLA